MAILKEVWKLEEQENETKTETSKMLYIIILNDNFERNMKIGFNLKTVFYESIIS